MQRLVLPTRYAEVLAGYKVPAYLKEWGYHHFGWDLFSYDNPVISERGKIYASGTGRVVAAGTDAAVGRVVVVRYDTAQQSNGLAQPLAARYFHLSRVMCYAGQPVTEDTLLGIEGNTGTAGTHLHVEFDRDVDFPLYSPQVKGANLICKGTDTTVDPATVFWARPGDVLRESRFGGGWNTPRDTLLAVKTTLNDAAQAELAALRANNEDLAQRLQTALGAKAGLETRILKIKELAG